MRIKWRIGQRSKHLWTPTEEKGKIYKMNMSTFVHSMVSLLGKPEHNTLDRIVGIGSASGGAFLYDRSFGKGRLLPTQQRASASRKDLQDSASYPRCAATSVRIDKDNRGNDPATYGRTATAADPGGRPLFAPDRL